MLESRVPITRESQGDHSLIRLPGEFTLASAGELKRVLLEWQAAGGDLRLDLEGAGAIDITLLQLLVAAGREAALSGAGITAGVSPAAAAAARDLGFDRFPGATAQL
jgi:anti-anti-sigma regulatory factor